MSGSNEKKTQAALSGEGGSRKRKADEEALAEKKFRRNAIIAVVCIVLVVAAALVINSNLFYQNLTAVKVGNTSYSPAELNVFYRNTYNGIYSSYSAYGELASYMLPDSSTPLDEQNYDDERTWADYLLEQTEDNLQEVTALYDAAMAAGYTMTDADRESVSSQIASMESYAASNNMSNINQFLSAYYGKGVTAKVYESVITRLVIAESYRTQLLNEMTWSDEELRSWYAGHKDEYDVIEYAYYYIGTTSELVADSSDEEKLTAAKAIADGIAEAASGGDLTSFEAAVAEYADGAEPYHQYTQGQSLSSYYSEWLLDGARKAGDTTAVQTDSAAYAVMYLGRDDNDYALRSMRHILINSVTDEEGEYTEAGREESRTRIEEIRSEWEQNPTEDNFAELANQYSEDAGSNTNGGLYEEITRHQMVESIDDFLFNEGHSTGDTGVVFGESTAYEGWHLVYYAGEGENYQVLLSENNRKDEAYTEYIDGTAASYPVSTGSGLRYAKLG